MAGVCSASLPIRPFALHRDPAAGARVFQRALCTRLDRQFFGAEQLLAVDRAVDDPLVGIAIAAAIGIDDRLDVVCCP